MAEARALAHTLNADRRQLSEHQRRAAGVALRQDGHSARAIAGALGVSEATVRRDVAATASVDAVAFPERVIGLDGKSRPSRQTVQLLGPASFSPW